MKNKRITLQGVIEYDDELRRFELIYEDGEFHGFYLSDDLWDDAQCLQDAIDDCDEVFYYTLNDFKKGRSVSFDKWLEDNGLI